MTTAPSTTTRVRAPFPVRMLGTGLLVAFAGPVVGGVVQVLIPFGVWTMVVVGFASVVGAILTHDERLSTGVLVLSILLAVFAAPLMGFIAADAFRLAVGTEATEVPVAEAPAGGAVSYRFADARVEPKFRASFTARGRSGPLSTYTVAPVLGPGWKTGDPVPCWAGWSSNDPAPNLSGESGGTRVGSLDEDHFRSAVEKAEKRYGLVSADGAPVLAWGRYRDELLSDKTNLLFGSSVIAAGVWCAGLTGMWWWGAARTTTSDASQKRL